MEKAGFEMGVEEFAVKDTVVLVRSNSVPEMVGWVSSETGDGTEQVRCLLSAQFCP